MSHTIPEFQNKTHGAKLSCYLELSSMAKTLFIHSTGTAPFMWDSIPEDVVPSADRIAPANLGYPPYDAVPRGRKTSLAQEAAHVLTQIPADGPLDLVAHSYGGLVALELLPAIIERVRSIIFFEPVLFGALMKDPTADQATLERASKFLENDWFLTDDAKGGTDPWLEMFIDYWNRYARRHPWAKTVELAARATWRRSPTRRRCTPPWRSTCEPERALQLRWGLAILLIT